MPRKNEPNHKNDLNDVMRELAQAGATRQQVEALVKAVRPLYGSVGTVTWYNFQTMLDHYFSDQGEDYE